jgi:hypothetical protein
MDTTVIVGSLIIITVCVLCVIDLVIFMRRLNAYTHQLQKQKESEHDNN